MLINLVGNAIKFTESGTVKLAVSLLSRRGEEVRLRFTVSDTGIGITPEQRSRLFRSFSQADGSITRKYGGTGLGLIISKRLVELMGGEIDVDSVPGRGSTFHFSSRFTVSDRASVNRQARQTGPGPGWAVDGETEPEIRGARVLLVEDDDVNQEIGIELLESRGMTVRVADDGSRALEWIEREPFDLILMDIQMPRMDGYETTRAIRQRARFEKLPIIAMTAHALSGDREKCLASGMSDYLDKPIDPERLYEMLQVWLPVRFWPAGSRTVRPAGIDGTTGSATGSAEPPVLPGISRDKGLFHLGGNVSLYEGLLKKFYHGQIDGLAKIKGELARGRVTEARHLVHRIKGVSGSLGAVELHRAAIDLETRLSEEKKGRDREIGAAMERFEHDLETVLTGIGAWLRQHSRSERDATSVPIPVSDAGRVNALLKSMTGLLDQDLGEVMKSLELLRPLLERSPLAGRFEALQRALLDFDTDAARSIIQGMMRGS